VVATDWTRIVTPRRRLTQKVAQQISEAAGVSLSEWSLAGWEPRENAAFFFWLREQRFDAKPHRFRAASYLQKRTTGISSFKLPVASF